MGMVDSKTSLLWRLLADAALPVLRDDHRVVVVLRETISTNVGVATLQHGEAFRVLLRPSLVVDLGARDRHCFVLLVVDALLLLDALFVSLVILAVVGAHCSSPSTRRASPAPTKPPSSIRWSSATRLASQFAASAAMMAWISTSGRLACDGYIRTSCPR